MKYRATSQWFANLDEIKDNALEALRRVSFYPPQCTSRRYIHLHFIEFLVPARNRLESFIRSRSEWCISRQRVWGVPIPSLHHIPTDTAYLDNMTLEHILSVLEEKGVAYWWTGPVEAFIPTSLLTSTATNQDEAGKMWKKGTDTMDVWFDSGTSWSMLQNLDGEKHREFLADVCLEGSDQHRGWFQSQLLTKVGSHSDTLTTPSSPYCDLITHGMVLDESGKKMSKSLGNIVSPMTIIHGGKDKKKHPAYGADVLRLWVATVEYWRDMAIGPKILSQAAETMRKIRNSTRFLLGNLSDGAALTDFDRVPREQLGLVRIHLKSVINCFVLTIFQSIQAERYVMHELYTLQQTAFEGYATYNFPKGMFGYSLVEHFMTYVCSHERAGTFCQYNFIFALL